MHCPSFLQLSLQPLQRGLILHRRAASPWAPGPQPWAAKLGAGAQLGTIGAQRVVGTQHGAVTQPGARARSIAKARAACEPGTEAGARIRPGTRRELRTGRAAGTRRRRRLLQQHRFQVIAPCLGLDGSGTMKLDLSTFVETDKIIVSHRWVPLFRS